MTEPGTGEDLWVFGYGSLMWRPGFEHLECHRGVVHGYHRAFCIYSWVHRGTRERPGLVLGLDRGGSCVGRLYRVAAGLAADTIRYLDAREMVTAVYRPVGVRVRVDGRVVTARTYVADRRHPQYARGLSLERQADLVRAARGRSGGNRDYVVQTVDHLEDIGIVDGPLHDLKALVRKAADGAFSDSANSRN